MRRPEGSIRLQRTLTSGRLQSFRLVDHAPECIDFKKQAELV